MLYAEWILAALGVIVVYTLLGYAWVLWIDRKPGPGRPHPPSEHRRLGDHQPIDDQDRGEGGPA